MMMVMQNIRKRRNQGLRTFVTSLMLISFCAPSPATAVTLSQLKGNSGFRAMVIAIANLNIAMQQATINPHDKSRRARVATAYSMMPLAITALAKEFKSNKLHDNDFQYVQGILGGFVQKDLTSKVEEFMKDPSKRLIPNVGSEFPTDAIKQAEDSYIVANEEKSLLANYSDQGNSSSAQLSKTPSDIVDLNSRSNQVAAQSKVLNSKPVANDSIVANDSLVANSSKSILNSTQETSAQGTNSTQKTDSFKSEISKDIQDAEATLNNSIVRAPASSEDEKDKEKEDNSFFKFKEKKKKEIKERKIRKGSSPKTSFLNTYQRKPLWVYAWDILFVTASAEQPAPAAPCEGGGKECGQGGGGGGGGGGGAGDILFGLAAMIAAAAPMVAAAVQADADKQIARINANTAITNANTQAALQRYSIDQQTGLAKFQAEATQQIADQKNQKEMAQLKLQLDELAASRQQQADLEREKRATEQANLEQELALKEQQALQTIQLAQQQRLAQEVAQGLSTGLQNINTNDNGSRLSVTQAALSGGIGMTASSQVRSSSVANGTPGANPAAGTQSRLGTNPTSSVASTQGASTGSSVAAATSVGAKSPSTLGSAFKTAQSALSDSNTIVAVDKKTSQKTASALITAATQPVSRGLVANRNIASLGTIDSQALAMRGLAKIGQGSSKGFKQRIAVVKNIEKPQWSTDSSYAAANEPESMVNSTAPVESQHTQVASRRGFLFRQREVRDTSVPYER